MKKSGRDPVVLFGTDIHIMRSAGN